MAEQNDDEEEGKGRSFQDEQTLSKEHKQAKGSRKKVVRLEKYGGALMLSLMMLKVE